MSNRLLISFFLLLNLQGFGQGDTTVNKKHYSFVDYYKNGKVAMLGNYKDTVKTGHWTFYTNGGKVLAYGRYRKGKKAGRWHYKSDKETFITMKWNRRKCTESIEFDKINSVVIYDTYGGTMWGRDYMFMYRNGHLCKHATFL